MLIHCPACDKDFDDVFTKTSCPHQKFPMHCGVFVNGVSGCAHTIEELMDACHGGAAPNTDCPMVQLVTAFEKDEPLAGWPAMEVSSEETLHPDAAADGGSSERANKTAT